MPNIRSFVWGLSVGLIALLNVLEVPPDWMTIAAVLTLPFFAGADGMRCAVGARGDR